MSFLEILRVIFGSIYVLFVPGFLLTFIFFTKKEMDWLERVIIGFALSIAIVPLVVFLFNLIGVKITALNVFLEIMLIIVLSGAYIMISKKMKKK